MSSRVNPEEDLSARVMFASDRICCVCRDRSKKKVQLHHIDEDSSNTTYENLAVLCLDCHSDTRTKHAFARNLTPDLVQLYNTSWRQIVLSALTPGHPTDTLRDYTQEAVLELGLACHQWKNWFIAIPNCGWTEPAEKATSVWDFLEHLQFKYSVQAYQHYLGLFGERLQHTMDRLEHLCILHAQVVPVALKIAVIRAVRQLSGEKEAYAFVPAMVSMPLTDPDIMFAARFRGVFQVLANLSNAADDVRSSLSQSQASGPQAAE